MSWFSSSLTELVEELNSLASSLRYDLVLGLKKKRISSLILVFDDISPENRFSNFIPLLSSFSTHKVIFLGCQLVFLPISRPNNLSSWPAA